MSSTLLIWGSKFVDICTALLGPHLAGVIMGVLMILHRKNPCFTIVLNDWLSFAPLPSLSSFLRHYFSPSFFFSSCNSSFSIFGPPRPPFPPSISPPSLFALPPPVLHAPPLSYVHISLPLFYYSPTSCLAHTHPPFTVIRTLTVCEHCQHMHGSCHTLAFLSLYMNTNPPTCQYHHGIDGLLLFIWVGRDSPFGNLFKYLHILKKTLCRRSQLSFS